MHKYIPLTLDPVAVETCIQAAMGQPIDACVGVDAAYHIAGFALGKLVPCDHPQPVGFAPVDVAEKVALLRKLQAPADVVAAPEIPWYLIWQVVKEIVERYLSGK